MSEIIILLPKEVQKLPKGQFLRDTLSPYASYLIKKSKQDLVFSVELHLGLTLVPSPYPLLIIP